MFNPIITEKEEKFNEIEKKIYKFVCELGCWILKEFLEKEDEKINENRDKKTFRNKGKRTTSVKTIMGEVTFERTMYKTEKQGYVYLLDEALEIGQQGLMSESFIEKALSIVVNTTSYRKAAKELSSISNTSISHEGIRDITIASGEEIDRKEKQEVKLLHKNKLVKGTKEVPALFEEADGLWIKLQGKDQEEGLKKRKEEFKKKSKKLPPHPIISTEIKLHIMYEEWKKDDSRHALVAKKAIAGIMKPKELKELRDARVYQKYDVEKIQLRVTNGDGAKWTKGTTAKGGIYQKDLFHIQQEITRDVPKEYRHIIQDLFKERQYEKIPKAIEQLKYEVGGEIKAIEKLNKLKSYLSEDLARYTEVLENSKMTIPQAPEGIEYRNLGTQESQIFSFLKTRFCSGRKSFSKRGANALAKVCVLVKESQEVIKELKRSILEDNSVDEYIAQIEKKVAETKKIRLIKTPIENVFYKTSSLENVPKFVKEIIKEKDFMEMKCSF